MSSSGAEVRLESAEPSSLSIFSQEFPSISHVTVTCSVCGMLCVFSDERADICRVPLSDIVDLHPAVVAVNAAAMSHILSVVRRGDGGASDRGRVLYVRRSSRREKFNDYDSSAAATCEKQPQQQVVMVVIVAEKFTIVK